MAYLWIDCGRVWVPLIVVFVVVVVVCEKCVRCCIFLVCFQCLWNEVVVKKSFQFHSQSGTMSLCMTTSSCETFSFGGFILVLFFLSFANHTCKTCNLCTYYTLVAVLVSSFHLSLLLACQSQQTCSASWNWASRSKTAVLHEAEPVAAKLRRFMKLSQSQLNCSTSWTWVSRS